MKLSSWAAVVIIAAASQSVDLPAGKGGIGFDDLRLAPGIGKLLVPAGRTGDLDLVDPVTREVTAIGGFSHSAGGGSGHGTGTTSADEGPKGIVFAADRSTRKLEVVDTAARKIVASVALAAGPDYVRWVEPTREIWVTEPAKERIEVFALGSSATAAPVHRAFVEVKGGPESLVIDRTRRKAYTHLWEGTTVAVGLSSRKVEDHWPNGCRQSQGIALDEKSGWLFAACEEATLVVLDLDHHGKPLSKGESGKGVDIIDYDPARRRVYFPGEESATMGVFAVSSGGGLSLLRTLPTAEGAHCVVSDGRGGAWVCDPQGGRLLYFQDLP